MKTTVPPLNQDRKRKVPRKKSKKMAVGPLCLEHEDSSFPAPDRCRTHSVSGLPDRHLARENIEVFPRLAIIPELEERKDNL